MAARRMRNSVDVVTVLARALVTTLLLSLSGTALAEHPQAPDFSLPAIANATGDISLAQYRGAVTYVDFWASWCGPCRLSLPALDTLYQELASEGLKVIAISVDVVEEDAQDFLQRYRVTYPVAIDTTGDIARAFSVNGMPSGYLLDKAGRVRAVHVGFKRGDELKLREEISSLLAE